MSSTAHMRLKEEYNRKYTHTVLTDYHELVCQLHLKYAKLHLNHFFVIFIFLQQKFSKNHRLLDTSCLLDPLSRYLSVEWYPALETTANQQKFDSKLENSDESTKNFQT